jgi:hypothetical protein
LDNIGDKDFLRAEPERFGTALGTV